MAVVDRWAGLTRTRRAQLGGARWEVRWRDDAGRQHRRRMDDHAAAEAFYAASHRKAAGGSSGVREALEKGFDVGLVVAHRHRDLRTLTVADAVAVHVASKRHLSARGLENVKVHAGHVVDELGTEMMHELTRAKVQDWVSAMTCAPSSGAKRLTLLRSTFKLMGMPDVTVGITVRQATPLRVPLTPSDVRAISRITRTPTPSKHGPSGERPNADAYEALVLVMGLMGLRVSEACDLRVRHFTGPTAPPRSSQSPYQQAMAQQATGMLHVPGTKTATSVRDLAVPPTLTALLQGLTQGRGLDEYLFSTSTGTPGERIQPCRSEHSAASSRLPG